MLQPKPHNVFPGKERFLKEQASIINRIAFIGNYLPRQCGITTFTTDLCEAVASAYSKTTCIALPVNDIEAGYVYPSRVRFELTEKDIHSYTRATMAMLSIYIMALQIQVLH